MVAVDRCRGGTIQRSFELMRELMDELMRELVRKTSNLRKRLPGLLSVVMAGGCCHTALRAQDVPLSPRLSSELGHQNLSRVAASAADINAILVKDAGLMVEIKRWLAKDATEHGQIVSDSALNDDAIFDRWQTDFSFVSLPPTLLQRYGYLVPRVTRTSKPPKRRSSGFKN